MQETITSLNQEQIDTSIVLPQEQAALLAELNAFAHYQIAHDREVWRMPAKGTYKVNAELKLALVALLTTCSLLDYKREGQEAEKFFEAEIKIVQKNSAQKYIDFGRIRPVLILNFLVPEIVQDWILYRDVNGDGIHALVDKKTDFQGLTTYARGGNPVYEFSRFYRKFMEHKIARKKATQNDLKKIAMKSLCDELVQRRLASGGSAGEILDHILNDDLLALDTSMGFNKPLLPKK